MPISAKSLLALFVGVTAVLADGPPSTHSNKFSGLGLLDEAYSGASFGLNQITAASYTKTKWAWGKVPDNCYNTAVNNNYCNPYDIEVYEVKYNDCDISPTVICRCNNANLSIDAMATRIAKLPPKARQWISVFHAFPAASCSAWYQNGQVVFLGACTAQSVFFHEVGHGMDQYAIGPWNNYYSASQEWKDKVLAGSCVPDQYAKSSWQESYAQVAVMAAYHGNVQSIWNLNVGCMSDQMGKVNEQLIDKARIFKRVAGDKCDRSWGAPVPVCMGPAARDAGACSGISSTARIAVQAEQLPTLDPETLESDKARKEKAEQEARPVPAAKTSANEKKFTA